jgi:hypothetical protein
MTVLKTEFKYIITEIANIPVSMPSDIQKNNFEIVDELARFPHDIFQPPKV